MFLFNAVILMAGCGLLGFGVYIRTSPKNRISELNLLQTTTMFSGFTLALIISGGVVIILSFFGCCGAIKEVKCMLGTFFLMLCVMLIGLIAGGVVAYIYRDNIGENTIQHLRSSFKTSYGIPGNEKITEGLDFMQKMFKCCGVTGGVNSTESWMYYQRSSWFNEQEKLKEKQKIKFLDYVPESCCVQEPRNLTKCQGRYSNIIPALNTTNVTADLENDSLYTEGCYNSFIDILEENIKILVGVIAGVAVLMIMGMVFSICLCRRIEDEFIFD